MYFISKKWYWYWNKSHCSFCFLWQSVCQRWLKRAAAGRWHRFPPRSPPTQILGPCSVSFISDWERGFVCSSESTPNVTPGTLAYWLAKLWAPGGVPYGTITEPQVTLSNHNVSVKGRTIWGSPQCDQALACLMKTRAGTDTAHILTL